MTVSWHLGLKFFFFFFKREWKKISIITSPIIPSTYHHSCESWSRRKEEIISGSATALPIHHTVTRLEARKNARVVDGWTRDKSWEGVFLVYSADTKCTPTFPLRLSSSSGGSSGGAMSPECSGYFDADGAQVDGFFCPRPGNAATAVYCCGFNDVKYCCDDPNSFYPYEYSYMWWLR